MSKKGVTLKSFSNGHIRRGYSQDWKQLPATLIPMPAMEAKPVETLKNFLSINRRVIFLVFLNGVLLHRKADQPHVFANIQQYLRYPKDDYLYEMGSAHLNQVKSCLPEHLPSLVYLAYLENELGKQRPVLDDRIILPDAQECDYLSEMIISMTEVFSVYEDVHLFPSLEGAYHGAVVEGTVDLMTEDTLWTFRTHSKRNGVISGSEFIPLVVCWLMLPYTDKYKDKEIRYLAHMAPLDGRYARVDVNEIDPELINTIKNVLYPAPSQPTPDSAPLVSSANMDTTLMPDTPVLYALRKMEIAKLAYAFLVTINQQDEANDYVRVHRELQNICCALFTEPRIYALCRQIAELSKKPPVPFDTQCQDCRQRAILLNQLYYSMNNLSQSRIKRIMLDDETVTTIILKAKALYR